MKNRILFVLADGFEETECVVPFDILSRGDVQVTFAGIHDDVSVEGAHGLTVKADILLSEAELSDFDGVFLPGGSRGVENLMASARVLEIVRDFYGAGKWVLSICPGTAEEFGFAVLEALEGKEKTERVRAGMLARLP